MSARTGADLLVEGFEALGVDCVFGLPGTQVVAVFESLRRRGLRVVVPTHELAAGFMAMGYARASTESRPGILITIPGPGFTYALTPLAEAMLDGVPLVLVTLAPTRGPDGGPGFQAVDQSAIARPLVKEIVDVPDAGAVPAALARAAARAIAQPQGPVLLHLAEGALGELTGMPAPVPPVAPGHSAPDFSEALAALRRAERPVVVVTGDFDAPGLGMIAARDRVPVCVTAAARGALPDDHRWALTFDDQRTSVSALNEFLATVDCCLVLGGQLSHVATAGYALNLPDQHMIWVRPAAGGGERYFPKARKIEGEPRDLVEAWRREGAAPASKWTDEQMRDWHARLTRERRMALPEPRVHGVEGNTPEGFFDGFGKAVPRDAIVITDSGLHQVLARRHLEVSEPRGLLFPSDFQSMGFGIPAAIGAHLAAGTRPVVALVGDGGFLMTGLEMLTAVKESVPLVVVVFNDGQLNLIRLQQIREYGREHGVAVPAMDYEAFARAAGILYRLVDGDPALALRDALAANAPALVELRLGDSPAVTRTRATSLVRETARGVLGRSFVKWLKRRFR